MTQAQTAQHTMRAAVLEAYDAPFRLADIARPAVGSGQVLVRVAAAGLNPLDGKIRKGQAAHARQPAPSVLGLDLAGVVEAVGSGVEGFRTGDAVYGLAGGVGGHQGALAGYRVVDARLLARAPANLTLREAAALPLVVVTAWEGLVDRANVQAGQTVLVIGAGGVGLAAIQIAQARGAIVAAVDTAAKREVVERLGARFFDREASIPDTFDIVYDTVGALDVAFGAVRRNGHVVSSLGWGSVALAPLSFKAATYSGVFTLLPLLTGEGLEAHGEILRQAAALVEAGKLAPRLDPHRFTLDAVDAAFETLAGPTDGKLVVEIA